MVSITNDPPLRTSLLAGIRRSRIAAWARVHRLSLAYALPITLVGGFIRYWNIWGSPGMTNDDEGTYVSQAWAILHNTPWQWLHNLQLAHYTYWYDHPPFGWIQIAAWAGLTNGFARYDVAIMVGRELVVVYGILSAVMLYAFCRTFTITRGFSALAMALMLVSPIAMTSGRMAYLDALSVPWVIGSLLAARYVHEHNKAVLSGLLLAGAIMTKETTAVFIPVVLLMVIIHSPKSLRVINTIQWVAATALVGGGLYLWYAYNRGELLAGPDHVSIEYAAKWQLLSRGGSGSIFDPSSLAFETFSRWARDDWYLLAAGLVLLPLVLFSRRLWPIGLAAAVNGALLLRQGYLPTPFVVVLIPLAALVVAAGFDQIWQGSRHFKWTGVAIKVMTLFLIGILAYIAVPVWQGRLATDLTVNNVSPERDAVQWMAQHVPTSSNVRIVTDDYLWPDLVERGYNRNDVDWFYKLDADPAVTRKYVPAGESKPSWTMIDYVILPDIGQGIINTRPTLAAALKHATVVATFTGQTSGLTRIYKINHDSTQGDK